MELKLRHLVFWAVPVLLGILGGLNWVPLWLATVVSGVWGYKHNKIMSWLENCEG